MFAHELSWLFTAAIGDNWAMQKPTLRVTKCLGDIPVEGRCSLCPDTLFHAISPHHRPQKAEYIERLQRAFDRHVADLHSDKTPV
jgi:hypothetical protein